MNTRSRRFRHLLLGVGAAGLIAMAGTAPGNGMSADGSSSHVAKGGSKVTTTKPTVTWAQTFGEPTTTATPRSQ